MEDLTEVFYHLVLPIRALHDVDQMLGVVVYHKIPVIVR